MRLKQRNPPEQNRSIDGCSLTAVNKKTPWDSKRNPAEFFYVCHFSCSRCLFVCISLPHYEIDKVNRIQQQHDQPVFSCEHLLFRTEEVQQHGGGNTDDAVDNKFLTECDRSQKAGSAENKKDIEDIAADDVAYSDIRIASQRGFCAGDQLRKTGSERHDGKTDHPVADTDVFGDDCSAVYGYVTA